MYDIVIIGAGPAALNAALYAARSNLNVVIVEKEAPGGKMLATNKIENWIGDKYVTGFELATRFLEHTKKAGAKYQAGEVVNIRSNNEFNKEVLLANGQVLQAKSVIIATGMMNREPSFIKNLNEFKHKGFSYCGICDGPMFKGMPMVVLGGGNSAVEEGTFLASVASKLYVITNIDHLTAEKSLINDLLSKKNVEILYNTNVKELKGKSLLESVIIEQKGKNKELKANAFFSYIGMIPATDFLKDLMITNDRGFIKTNEIMETQIPNIFAVGDVRDKEIRQIITAASDGAIAAKTIVNRLG
ncbi:thioredoxin reductase [Mycoplasmopsis californica]|uniref:FAD-dependent oxidoreductase n=1 Tax=Mycoplasmopsis equigenitalium TaxID=114883 RepID=A0ABY5J1J9_9BACT|nr:FAD-dependent oxidoreductase [Mycoplasmopsis equigenitalium]UUD37130.1 FAD-dependent oxidoreductase [Mycoplasmopsis equigenitalium]VEU69564.1 thioredoxin reductase [Mycoplasmopsis californica]